MLRLLVVLKQFYGEIARGIALPLVLNGFQLFLYLADTLLNIRAMIDVYMSENIVPSSLRNNFSIFDFIELSVAFVVSIFTCLYSFLLLFRVLPVLLCVLRKIFGLRLPIVFLILPLSLLLCRFQAFFLCVFRELLRPFPPVSIFVFLLQVPQVLFVFVLLIEFLFRTTI